MKRCQNDNSGHSQDHESTPTPAMSNCLQSEPMQLQNNKRMATCHQTKQNDNGKTRGWEMGRQIKQIKGPRDVK
jgi:hypothetical protein